TVSVTHFWGLDGVVPPPATIDLRAFLYFRSRMEAGQGRMTFERPDDLPPEAAAERAALETLGIRSFAAISRAARSAAASGGRSSGRSNVIQPWPASMRLRKYRNARRSMVAGGGTTPSNPQKCVTETVRSDDGCASAPRSTDRKS